MKNVALTLGLLSGLATALPAPQSAEDPIVRILPARWDFKITSLKGPGCPDFGVVDGANNVRATRLTYGQNTMDGSEIYYWFIAYPHLRVETGKTESVWCETELEYTDSTGDWQNPNATWTPTSDYRLRLHKNGTQVIWGAKLDENVKATISFTYQDVEQTDDLTINGPTEFYDHFYSLNTKGGVTKVAKCGATKLKFRTELTVSGTGIGVVHSAGSDPTKGTNWQYYGTQLGFSYDWEKC